MAVSQSNTLLEALMEARAHTLALVEPLSDADLESTHDPLMSPLVWDLAHIAAYEDLWIGTRLGGGELLRPEHAAMYDAFETPRAVRGDLPLLDRAGALEYLEASRARTLEVLASREDAEIAELVLRHELQHTETMLQATELARLPRAPGLPRRERPAAAREVSGLEGIEVPGGSYLIGAPAEGFAYDNERPRHEAELGPFRIGRHPVTNGDWAAFAEGGGYTRREWWSDSGWAWRQETGAQAPGGWRRGGNGAWSVWRVDGEAPLAPSEPVVHVSFWEAEAFAHAHGARLPTESEWEAAAGGDGRPYPWGDEPPDGDRANLDQGAGGPVDAGTLDGASPSGAEGMLGDVWEWTSSDFTGYPGFRAHPYREYSEVFFGDRYKVLRGGSWATRARVASVSFRNWDLPQRRQIYSGLRLVWDLR